MKHTIANVGQTDPTYGGVLTDISTLPVGTKFFVRNGAWYGRIVDLDGVKGIQTSSRPLVGDEVPVHRKPVPLFPEGSDDNVLALSDIQLPTTTESEATT